MKKLTKVGPLSYVVSFLLFLAVAEIVCFAINPPDYLFPRPSQVFAYLIKYAGTFASDMRTTGLEVLLGFLIGFFVGAGIAFFVTMWPPLGSLFRPVVILSQTFPIQAVAPIIIIWFGTGALPKVITSALLVFFPVALGLSDGFARISPALMDFMKALRASRSQIFWLLQFPNAFPAALTATKIGVTLSVIGAVIGEFLTAESGLGLRIRQGMNELNTTQSFAALYLLGFFGLALYSCVDSVERVLLRHYRLADSQ
jgi:ABC-type nitrate/sulfonate/bicarbonate transport system permease component